MTDMPDKLATAPNSKTPSGAASPVSSVVSRKPNEPGFSTIRLVAGENSEELNDLCKELLDFLKPRNVIERILISDFIHNEWELRRVRKFGSSAIPAARPWSVSRLNGHKDERFCDSPLPKGSYKAGIAGLEAKGYPLEDIDAFSALSFASALESFDKRASSLELRRNAALAALEDRRAQSALAERTIDATADEERPTMSMRDGE